MAEHTFFWYDLETSGFNPRQQRIMQFAGQRTDMDLHPVGEPVNVLIKLTDDVLPDPDAVLLTGITPQMTITGGITEADFLGLFYKNVATPGTIFAGYNTVRFDDEFMRFLNYRNFYDAYEWQWKDERSRWDLLDVVRMTRALRPEGIKWPFDTNGKASNRLELLTSVNKLDHENAHDALSDVNACIALAKLIKEKQPDLFKYLLKMRDKKEVARLVQTGQPFVYTSGKYSAEFEKTTIAVKLADHPSRSGALVYDLRHDPTEFLGMTPSELANRWQWTKDENAPPRLPIKTLRYNACPAVAPVGVLDSGSQKRLKLNLKAIETNRQKLMAVQKDFANKVCEALKILDQKQQTSAFANPQTVDGQLYDSLLNDADRAALHKVRAAKPAALAELQNDFKDARLKELLPLYKARNFPKVLTAREHQTWEDYRLHKLTDGGDNSQLGRYMKRLQELAAAQPADKKRYLLEELQLYAESIMPLDFGA